MFLPHKSNALLSSKPRNQYIANTMFKAGFIDTWGRGYLKIHDGFKKAGLPMPTVISHCGGTLVSFQRGYDVARGRKFVTSDGSYGGSGGSLAVVQLSDIQIKICKLVKKNPRITVNQMSEVLAVAKRTLERNLSKMQQMGVLIREGNTSAGHWVVLTEMIAGLGKK